MKSKKYFIILTLLVSFQLIQAEEKDLITKITDSITNSWHETNKWIKTTWSELFTNKIDDSSSPIEQKVEEDLIELAQELDNLEEDQEVNVNVFEDEI